MKSYTLEEAQDKVIGKRGTPRREEYETNVKWAILGDTIRAARKKRKLTQAQLGERVGVKKAQISRLENNAGNVTVRTLLRVFRALDAKVHLNIEMLETEMELA